MDGLKELHPQQATEWYYPNLMHRFVWCGTGKKKKCSPILFCVVFEYGKTCDNWHNVSI